MNLFCVVVTFNPVVDNLNRLIKTLLNANLSLVIVDNNSCNKKELKKLIINQSEIILVENSSNVGIAKAQNLGIEKAIQLEANHIIFFDQDSNVGDHFIDDLVCDYKYITKKNEKIAAIGPRFIDENRGFYFPAIKFNKYGLIDKINVENINAPIEVSFLISSGTLVSVDSLKVIGMMKENFFIDFVDTEWCFRALSRGYKIYMSEKAVMKHSIGDDTINFLNFKIPVHSGYRRYYRIRNLFFMWKTPYIPKILTAKLMVTNFIIQILLFLMKDKKIDYIKYYYKAIQDGLKQSKDYHA